MTNLPVIVGFGGYNAAGRSSFHHAYRRTVLNSLSQEKQAETLLGLASLMELAKPEGDLYRDLASDDLVDAQTILTRYRQYIEDHTLIRRIDDEHFDPDRVPSVNDLTISGNEGNTFSINRRELPQPVPANWETETISDDKIKVTVRGEVGLKATSFRKLEVQAAGILPRGFKPADKYNSRFHPRGLQMAVLGASDCLNSMGISWDQVLKSIAPDEIAVFAASALGQTDEYGLGGYLQARLKSSRPNSKQMALALNSMPADFINAYVCGSTGTTGSMAGACATFLYNLRLGVDDIVAGRHRMVIVGSAEANVSPEVLEGFNAMSALATDERLAKLDGADEPDYRRASRPFADNCGFTLAESTQYFVLMDDALALELGADIYAAVPNVFVNADGYKKSISSPGAGNYITLAKAVAATQAIVGEETIQKRSFVQAHGSSTPQNRITESMIFDKVAKAFSIKSWPVTAVKAFVGHPLGPASGDQLSNTLGCFADGILPGIKTASVTADDVVDENLNILMEDAEMAMDVAFLNSKGFGGNNATASVLAPNLVEKMLSKRYGDAAIKEYHTKREVVRAAAQDYDAAASGGDLRVIYRFGEGIIEDHEIEVSTESVSLASFPNSVNLKMANPFGDMTD